MCITAWLHPRSRERESMASKHSRSTDSLARGSTLGRPDPRRALFERHRAPRSDVLFLRRALRPEAAPQSPGPKYERLSKPAVREARNQLVIVVENGWQRRHSSLFSACELRASEPGPGARGATRRPRPLREGPDGVRRRSATRPPTARRTARCGRGRRASSRPTRGTAARRALSSNVASRRRSRPATPASRRRP